MWIETTMPSGQRSRRGTSMMPGPHAALSQYSQRARRKSNRSVSRTHSRSPTAMRNGFSASTGPMSWNAVGCGFKTRRVCVLVPASSSRTIGGEKEDQFVTHQNIAPIHCHTPCAAGRLERGE